ncbi:uncharacterized protein LOC120897917 [Anopheles arabiensis]|uniref:uncharacterized protein LOC120897917 n=1 Tax=Anopheles arabiensis TaxID=7173 RepID=UPI001AAC8BFC|nr:uncharacterized protein LOC120897917 [Anopheles arabiensis]
MLVSRLKDGKLLIKVANQKQAEKIKKIKTIPDHRGEIQVQTLEHPTLNCSKGVIRCPDIEFLTEGEILDGPQTQKATEVIILKRKINNVLTNTRTAIVTFKTGRIPRTVDFGLYPLKVELYIPRPMRCTTCMRLGHTKKSCQREKICANCSEMEHKESCVRTKCVSCGDAHNTLDRNCPVFCDEMEISKIRTVNKITYGEAKRIRRRQCPEIPKIYTSDISYAQRTKSATKSRANHETNTWYNELCRSKGKKFARYQSSIENKMWHHRLKIPAKDIKTLNRLIAGHDYGNFWLHKMKLIDRGTCAICNVEDTASHRVFYCHKFDMERKDQLKINEQNFIKAWKTKDKKKMKMVIKFIKTNRISF